MPRLLPAILTRFHLPEAELHAARLDGELVAIDDGFGLIDESGFVGHRAESLRAVIPPRLIAEQRTAAWLYGARTDPPARHELCADVGARYRTTGMPRLVVREVVIGHSEIILLATIRVTTPRRTMLDLARHSEHFDAGDAWTLRQLASIGRLTVPDLLADLAQRPHLALRARAEQRIVDSLS